MSAVWVVLLLAGCASRPPLEESVRTKISSVAPVAARFAPEVLLPTPPSKDVGAATGGAVGVAVALGSCSVYLTSPLAPFFAVCVATIAPFAAIGGGVLGAVTTPSDEGIEPALARARGWLGAPDLQQLLRQRFSEEVVRFTRYEVADTAVAGPASAEDRPDYRRGGLASGTLLAELAVIRVTGTVGTGAVFSGAAAYPEQPLRLTVDARLRLVRGDDGAVVFEEMYRAFRGGRPLSEYTEVEGAKLTRALVSGTREIAERMVEDAFLLRTAAAASATSATGIANPPAAPTRAIRLMVTPVEPLSGTCFFPSRDCAGSWRFRTVENLTPSFRWRAFPDASQIRSEPWVGDIRDVRYDVRIQQVEYMGRRGSFLRVPSEDLFPVLEDERTVHDLTTTDYAPADPLRPCSLYRWFIRGRFATADGPRATDWNTEWIWPSSLDPRFAHTTAGVLFATPCAESAKDRPQ